jgi:hypothetical protein
MWELEVIRRDNQYEGKKGAWRRYEYRPLTEGLAQNSFAIQAS